LTPPLFGPAVPHRCRNDARGAASEERAMFDAAPRRPLVEVRNLKMYFPIHSGLLRRHSGDVKAVDGISFDIYPG